MWGKLKLLQATDEEIMIQDGKGADATIGFKSRDQPNEGFGYWICPDGNQDHTFNAILKDMIDFRQKVASASSHPGRRYRHYDRG